jgi:uncharacterized protein (TIGR00299 family) protein
MKVLYYDCYCGISGDMNLAALLDLGIDEDYLKQELSKLNLDSEYVLNVKKDSKRGICGTRVDVKLRNDQKEQARKISDSDSVCHKPQNRNLGDIKTLIMGSSLNDKVKELSLAMFIDLAEAEAKVHGKHIDDVHFHELGATDSIIDIVGAAICLDYLKVDKIMSSPIQVGGGFLKCAHGILPVPAPATIEILRNIPIKSGLVPFETTTPTGAVILAVNVAEFTSKMNFSVEMIGYGVGHRELEIPNILRVYIGLEKEKNNENVPFTGNN